MPEFGKELGHTDSIAIYERSPFGFVGPLLKNPSVLPDYAYKAAQRFLADAAEITSDHHIILHQEALPKPFQDLISAYEMLLRGKNTDKELETRRVFRQAKSAFVQFVTLGEADKS